MAAEVASVVITVPVEVVFAVVVIVVTEEVVAVLVADVVTHSRRPPFRRQARAVL